MASGFYRRLTGRPDKLAGGPVETRRSPAGLLHVENGDGRSEPGVAGVDVGPVVRLADPLVGGAKDHVRLPAKDRPLRGRDGVIDYARDRIEEPDHDRRHRSSGLADLVERPVHHAVVTGRQQDESDLLPPVPVDVLGQLPPRDLRQPGGDPVDAGERREGVVHGGRERSDCDLDELVDREDGILRERPVRAGDVRVGERLLDSGRRVGRPDGAERTAGDDEVAGPVGEADHRAGLLGNVHDLTESDELQVPALESRDRDALGVEPTHE